MVGRALVVVNDDLLARFDRARSHDVSEALARAKAEAHIGDTTVINEHDQPRQVEALRRQLHLQEKS